MFGKFKDAMNQLKVMQQLMKDENFKTLLSHPKFQELMKDPAFLEAAKGQDMSKLLSNPKFSAVLKDPELAALIAKIKPGVE